MKCQTIPASPVFVELRYLVQILYRLRPNQPIIILLRMFLSLLFQELLNRDTVLSNI